VMGIETASSAASESKLLKNQSTAAKWGFF